MLPAFTRALDMIKEKLCSTCKTLKPATLEFFYRRGPDKLQSRCLDCEKAKVAALPKKKPKRLDTETHKQCRRCKDVLPRSDFHVLTRAKDGLTPYCKPCQRAYNAESHAKNREARNAQYVQRLRACPQRSLNLRVLGPVRKSLERAGSPERKLSITGEFWKAVGYSKSELVRHIERQFVPGMSWANMREWHVDHIVPVSQFKLSSFSDPDFKVCWGLPNLRPLWARENLSKRHEVRYLL